MGRTQTSVPDRDGHGDSFEALSVLFPTSIPERDLVHYVFAAGRISSSADGHHVLDLFNRRFLIPDGLSFLAIDCCVSKLESAKNRDNS